MLSVAIASNVNILSDLVANDNLDLLVNQAYDPLLKLYGEQGIKSNIFFSGRTLEILEERYPSVLEMFQESISRGVIEPGSHTYGHPVMSLISREDVDMHMQWSKDLEKRIFGFQPKGFLPPEWVFDVTQPEVLRDFGYDWMVLLGAEVVGFYGQGKEVNYRPGTLLGSGGSKAKAVFAFDDSDDFTKEKLWFRDSLFDTFIGRLNPTHLAEEVYRRIQKNLDSGDNQLVVFYFDLETPAFNFRQDSDNNPCKNFADFMVEFLRVSQGQPVTISEYLDGYSNRIEPIHPILTRTYKDFGRWYEGSQKLDLEIALARPLVMRAHTLDPDHPKAKESMRHYLLSHSSDARAAASTGRATGVKVHQDKAFYGKRERVTEAYDHIYLARRLAQEVLQGQ